MPKPDQPTAAPFLPSHPTLIALQSASKACKGCPLYLTATQTVFGEGPGTARVVLVGEQPGDQEDLQGRPFVGPAGQLLNKALEEAGVDRRVVYVTNAVKHFKFEPRGKRRITRDRGVFFPHAQAQWIMATVHPSALLRMPEPERRREEYELFVKDLKQVRTKVA